MAKEEKEKKSETEKDLEQLKKEIAQKGKEIEQLKKTIEEMRTKIQGEEETGETKELDKIFEDVSEMLDVGFSIFGTSGKVGGEKSKGKGLIGLISDLAELAEKSGTYQKRVNLGKSGVIDFRVSSRPIKGPYTTKPADRLRISKPKKEASPTQSQMPPIAGLIKETEPIVDIFEEEEQIKVVAELPGVEEKEIDLDINENTVIISTDTSDRKYYKKVELPTPVKKDAVESSYRNGILEVKLRKEKSTSKTEGN